MKKYLTPLAPPKQWRLPVLVLLGILAGMGILIFHVSNASSYFSDDPATCMNCHVMAPQYATWERGSHGKVASCNDCHVPQDNMFSTYAFKASDGIRHASMFTFRLEPQVIRIKDAGRNVVQENCKRCHSSLIHMTSITNVQGKDRDEGKGLLCWDCHREVPHGRVNSLASTPNARIPILSPITPSWLEEYLTQSPQTK